MNENPHPSDELFDWLEGVCLGELSADDAARLQERLRRDEAARRLYVQYMHMHALAERFEAVPAEREAADLERRFLQSELHAAPLDAISPPSDQMPPPASVPVSPALNAPAARGQIAPLSKIVGVFNQIPVFATIFAAAFLFMGLTILAMLPFTRDEKSETTSIPIPEPPTVARIERADNCVWKPGAEVPSSRTLKIGRRLELLKGTLVLRYFSGARLALQGPVDYVVTMPNGGRLQRGRLAAEVSPAGRGFEIHTPSSVVVDLGTEFGVFVDEAGHSEIHVFEGRVEARSVQIGDESGRQLLEKNEAAAFHAEDIERIAARREDFTLLPAHSASPSNRWRDYLEKAKRDPDLVLHYGATAERVVLTSAAGLPQPTQLSDGTPAPLGSGRLPGDASIYLNGAGQHLVIEDAPELRLEGPLSLSLWFRIDQLPNYYVALVQKGAVQRNYSLFLSPEPGDGFCLHFNAWSADRAHDFVNSLTKLTTGKWMHGVGVVDDRGLYLYLNGKREASRDTHSAARLTERGSLLIGRSTEAKFPESFHGGIDDLMLFKRALSAEEVAAMYEAGRPH